MLHCFFSLPTSSKQSSRDKSKHGKIPKAYNKANLKIKYRLRKWHYLKLFWDSLLKSMSMGISKDNLRASITNGKQIPYSASHWLNVVYKTKHQKESIESLTISPTGYDKW